MAKFRAGKRGRTTVGTQTLSNKEWSTTYRGIDLDTTNFENNGQTSQLTGPVGVDWSLRGDWDAALNPLDDPPGLYPRDDGVGMILYTNVTDNTPWQFAAFSVTNAKTTTSASGLVTFDADGKSQPGFIAPTGSVP